MGKMTTARGYTVDTGSSAAASGGTIRATGRPHLVTRIVARDEPTSSRTWTHRVRNSPAEMVLVGGVLFPRIADQQLAICPSPVSTAIRLAAGDAVALSVTGGSTS